MAEETRINPITQTPNNAPPSIDTTDGTAKRVNPITGQANQDIKPRVTLGDGRMGEQMLNQQLLSTQYTTDRGESITNFTKYGIGLGQDLDWDELRARRQSTADQWGNGLAKAGVTTIGAVAENTLGIIFGLGELATGGAYYDNAIGRTVDKTNEWMRENMPNYLTREEQKMNTFQKLGTANFWADTVANGLGYSLGSIATMYLTGGLGPIGLTTKALSGASKGTALYNATKAVVNGAKLGTKLAKGASKLTRFARAAQVLEGGLMMSLAEASVEARESQRNTYQTLLDNYMQENLLENESQVPDDIIKQFEDVSYAAANTNFAVQLPVLAGTNLLMFGKQVAGYNAAMRETGDVILDGAKRKAVSRFANETTWQGVMNRMKPIAMNGVEEAFQEGFQFASGEFSHSYHTDKLKNNGYGDMGKALNEALSKTFGTQEGLESMLVGFITGGLMSGGQSIVNKDHSKRKANAEALANAINTGFFNGTTEKLGYANASSQILKRMQAAKERGDIKTYKDEQFKLISMNALQALEMGGFDVYRQKINDFADLSDTEFAEAMGISLVNEKGETLTLEQAAGESKSEIMSSINSKIDNLQQVYNNVNDRFALPEQTRGLPRLLMSEEARKAEDQTYRERSNLRHELVFRGAEVQDRTRRMGDIQKDMQETINKSLAANNKMMDTELNINNVLQDFSIFQTEPGETDAKDFDVNKRLTDMQQKMNKAYLELAKIDPIAAEKLKEQMQDYGKLAAETFAALDIYNKLASDPYAQAAFQRNLKIQQDAALLREQTKAFNEKFDKAETSEDVNKLLEDKDLPPSLKQKALAKELELRAKERQQSQKYLTQEGTSTQEKLDKLKKIDKTKLNPIEKAGLSIAIDHLENILKGETQGKLDVAATNTEENQVTDQEDATGEVQEAFDPDNLGGVEIISEDGRTFQIDGTTYYNKEVNPNDAVKRTERSKKIKYVQLEDANGNRRRFIRQQADALAYAIYMSEARKLEGQPTLDREAADAREKAAKEKIKRLAFGGKHGQKTNESLRSEIYELDKILDQLETDYDNLRYFFISEGATNKDINNEPEMRERRREMNSLRGKIRARKGVLKARGQTIGVSEMERVRIEGKAMESIEESKEYKSIVENEITELEKAIETLDQSMEEYKNNDDFDSFKAASAARKQAQQKLEQKRKDLLNAEAQIALEENKLKGIKNENETGLPEYGGQTTETTEGETQEQDTTREVGDNTEGVRKKRTFINVTPKSERLAALEETLSESDKRALAVLREKGQPKERIETFIRNRAKENGQGNTLTEQYKAEDIIANPEKYSEAVVVNAYRHLKGEGGPINTGGAESTTRRILEEVKKDIAEGVSIDSPSYYTGQKRELREAYEMMLKDMSDPVVEEDTVEPVGKSEKSIEKSVENNKRSQEAGEPASSGKQGGLVVGSGVADLMGMSEEDLRSDMPPVEGPTLGESLRQQIPAGVPPQGDNIDTKSAMSDRAIKDPATNRSQIEVSPAGSPAVNAPDTVDGQIIKINREALIQIQPGVEVEFQIIENDYYKENFPNGSVADIPVYFKIGDQIVGKLQRGEGQDRADIVRKLQAGERVTTQVASVTSPNFNNARTADGQKYFYDPRETFGGTPQLVGTVVTDGVVEFIGPSGSDLTMRTPQRTTPGQVGFLIPANQNPEGTDNVSMGSTANLTTEAVTAVGEALKQKNFDTAKEIVANSDESRRVAAYSDPKYLEFGQFGSGQNYMVYNSPTAGRLVRINDTQLQNALQDKPFKFSFVDVDQNGDFQVTKAEGKDYDRIKENFKKDLADFLGRKKYNVDLGRAGRTGSYTSPVNPNRVYDSYTDYLFSAEELGDVSRSEGVGYNSILTTDVVRTSVGYFHNPVITFSKGNLKGTTVEQISENTTFTSSKTPSVSEIQKFANEMGSPFAADLNRNDFDQDCK